MSRSDFRIKPLEPYNSEAKRLVSLHSLGLLGSEPNPSLDGITKAAAGLFGASMALVTLLDGNRQWFKAKFDPELKLRDTSETPRDIAFCDETIRTDDVMLVADPTSDGLYKANPLVCDEPGLRFYVGAPLITPEGSRIGALCVLDTETRDATAEQQDALARLSNVVVELLLTEAEDNCQSNWPNGQEAASAEQKILLNARTLLAEDGASGFSVRKVARAADVSLGHLQHYFKDKKSLLLAVLDSVAEHIDNYVNNELGAIDNPNDRIMRYGAFVLDRGSEIKIFQLLHEFWALASRDESIAVSIRSIHERAVLFLAAAIREANAEFDQQMAEARASVSLALLSGTFLFQGQSKERDLSIRQSVLESLIVLPSEAQSA